MLVTLNPKHTTQAQTDGVVWALDGASFRNILTNTVEARRQAHEHILASVDLFKVLTPENRAAIADCLHSESHEVGHPTLPFFPGEWAALSVLTKNLFFPPFFHLGLSHPPPPQADTVIVHQGDALTEDSKFYIVEKGELECYRQGEKGERQLVKRLTQGQWFGELALLQHSARHADVVAATKVKVCVDVAVDHVVDHMWTMCLLVLRVGCTGPCCLPASPFIALSCSSSPPNSSWQ